MAQGYVIINPDSRGAYHSEGNLNYWGSQNSQDGYDTSFTNPVHTHSTFAGFRQIPSKDKWLRVHNTNEWADYYQPEHVEDLRKFFDHYLKGVANDWEKTPRVWLSVFDPGHKDVVDRGEQEFPLARTQYKKLYLTGQQTLSWGKAAQEQVVSYDTPAEPVLKHTHEDLLQKDKIVPVDIGIWPMGMKYHAGEKLQLTIAAYQPSKADSVPPFGVAKIAVPEK